MLSMATKRQIINKHKRRYQRSQKKEKTTILNYLQETTGLSRDHLSLVLSGKYEYETSYSGKGRGRKAKYGMEHKDILVLAWDLLDFVSSRRLKAALPAVLDNLDTHEHLSIDARLKREVLAMSHGTMDRLLKFDRQKLKPFGLSTTKPGSLLKNQIPIRRGTDWDDAVPGFFEIDLVAHCGDNTRGQYANTLNCTDVASGWTECYAVINKARVHTLNAMKAIEKRLFFPLLGIDSDNGSEFINDHFLYYCRDNDLVFTRSRSNHSNDSCYVEQKNWSVVRKTVGYSRFEGQTVVDLLNEFYVLLSQTNNFFVPSQKLIFKERDGSKIRKQHDQPLTPYHRLMLDPNVDELDKQALQLTFKSLDLMTIRKDMDKLLAKIKALRIPY